MKTPGRVSLWKSEVAGPPPARAGANLICMSVVLKLLFIVCPLAAILFIVRLVCAPFSSKISDQIRRHQLIHWVWGGFGLVGALMVVGALNPAAWPPPSVERRAQRLEVRDRIETAGGWEALRHDCIEFAQTNEVVQWSRWFTNDAPALPPAIRALQPQQVYYVSPKLFGPHSDESKIPIVRIKVFGMHSTGGHSTPYFGLEVVATPSSEDYTPKARPAASGNGHVHYRKVSDGVYEIY